MVQVEQAARVVAHRQAVAIGAVGERKATQGVPDGAGVGAVAGAAADAQD